MRACGATSSISSGSGPTSSDSIHADSSQV